MSKHPHHKSKPAVNEPAKIEIKDSSLTTYVIGYLMMLVGFPLYIWGWNNAFSINDDWGFWVLMLGGGILIGGGFVLQPPSIKLNKPTERDEENWRTVPHKTFVKIAEAVERSIKQTYSSLNLGCVSGCVVYGILTIVIIMLLSNIEENYDFGSLLGVASGMGLLLLPFCRTDKTTAFVPPLLEKKMHHFVRYGEIMAAHKYPDIIINEQIRFDRDFAGKEIPEDVKYIFSLKKPPKCFVTAQLVMSINNVQGTEYEFLYSVFVFDKSMRRDTDKAMDIITRYLNNNDIGMGVEVTRDKQYTIGVFKLESGYHTNKKKAEKIVNLTMEALQLLADDYEDKITRFNC